MAEEKQNMPTVDDQYQRLIEARNFHYNNLNKWLMSFYAIIAALFVAFYKLYPDDIVIVIVILGYIVSLGALLSGKGYYYWEYKWIERLYRFEKLVLKYNRDDKQVYSALSNKKKHDNPYSPTDGTNISTTQIALFVTSCITIAWGFIIVMFGFFDMQFEVVSVLTSLGVSIVASYVFMLIGAACFPSHLDGLDELEDKGKNMNTSRNKKVVCTICTIFIVTVVLSITYGCQEGNKQSHESIENQLVLDTTETISAIIPSDSIINAEATKDIGEKKIMSPFWESALASAIGSFGVIFILFWLIRPRICIKKNYIVQPDGALTFCFRGYTLFKSVNVRIQVKAVTESGTDETEGNIALVDDYVASLSGILGKENDRTIGVHTKEPIKSIPKHLRVIVSAQHSVSGITAVTTRDIYTQ